MMNYLELAVRIGARGADGASAVHASSTQGEGDARMSLPFALADLLGVVHGLHPYVAPPPGADPAAPVAAPAPAAPEAAVDFGVKLFEALFTGEVRDIYERTQSVARSLPNTGVRVRLTMDLRD